jgi:tetratricopeptide (TPR) repeat protein/CHAT domain-containing protein
VAAVPTEAELRELRRQTTRGGKRKRLGAYMAFCGALIDASRLGEELLAVAQDGRRLALELGRNQQARDLGKIAALALEAMAEAQRSLELHLSARDEYERIGLRVEAARCQADGAGLLLDDGQHDAAMALLQPALEVFTQAGATKDVALVQLALARIASAEGDTEHAVRLAKSGISLLEGGDDLSAKAYGLHVLGQIHLDADQSEEASSAFLQAVQAWQAAGNADAAATCMSFLIEALKERGELNEAKAWIAQLRTRAERQGDRTAVAEADEMLGWLLLHTSQPRPAMEAFQRAQAALDRATDASAWLRCDAGIAQALLDVEEFDVGLPLLDGAIAGLRRLGSKPVELASLLQARGNASRSLERYDEAQVFLAEAEFAYKAAGQLVRAARCRQNIGHLLSELGKSEAAIEEFRAALEVFTAQGISADAARCHLALASELGQLGRYADGHVHLLRAATTFRLLGLGDEAAACDFQLAGFFLGGGQPSLALELYERHLPRLLKRGPKVTAAIILGNSGAALLDLRRYDQARSRLERARAALAEAGSSLAAARCDLNLAVLNRRLRQWWAALERALAAVAAVDGLRYTLRKPADRASWSLLHAQSYELALRLAEEMGETALLSELIESARVQALPQTAPAAAGTVTLEPLSAEIPAADPPEAPQLVQKVSRPIDLDLSAALMAAGQMPLGPPGAVQVAGISRLARSGRPSVVEPVVLEDMVAAVAGHEAWWWGTWVTRDVLWWSIVRPNAAPEAGSIPLNQVTPWLKELQRALPGRLPGETSEDAGIRVTTSPLLNNPEAEVRLAQGLGQALLPGPLATELRRRLDSDVPLPLVIAPAPQIGSVPFACLGLGDGKVPRRVVEAAVVHLAPSVALLDVVSRRLQPKVGPPWPLLVVVADPNEDLPGAGRVVQDLAELAPRIVLRGRAATPSALAGALTGTSPGAPGLVVYAGHAASAEPGQAYLLLAGEHGQSRASLSAWELLSGVPDEPGYRYPLPSRVLLAACATAGAEAAGPAGEWLGLAPATLWAGASVVAATTWPILDEGLTPELTARVAAALTTAIDPARALRAIQLDMLRRWQQGEATNSAYGNKEPATRKASPIHWAPFVVVGILPGSGSASQAEAQEDA